MDRTGHVIVGRVRRPHGIRGELLIEALTDAPDAVFTPGRRVFVGDVRGDLGTEPLTLRIARARSAQQGMLIAFDDIPDRTAAEGWRNRYLLVPFEELEPPGENELWVHDLIGMRVELVDGSPVGDVVAVYELPQGLMLEIGREGGGVLVPWVEEIVVRLDAEARVVSIDPPAGLLDG